MRVIVHGAASRQEPALREERSLRNPRRSRCGLYALRDRQDRPLNPVKQRALERQNWPLFHHPDTRPDAINTNPLSRDASGERESLSSSASEQRLPVRM